MNQTRARQLIVMLALLHVIACGNTPTEPSARPVELSCPRSIVLEPTQPDGAPATFDLPLARDGRPPYTINCSPSSGSVFPQGQTRVDCTVSDADQKQASCAFNVEVRASRRLTKTLFLAFGDSITAGTVSPAPTLIYNPDSYPFKVERLLRERYPVQEIVVLNDGVGGERPQQGAARLPSELEAQRPEVLLLLEGIISVRNIPTATNAGHLRTMISAARQRDIEVIMATVLPVGAGLEANQPGINAAVVRLNAEIGRLSQEFALGPPVDLYRIFHAEPRLIGRDDLHPTAEGYDRIAAAFNDAIVTRYDQPAP